MDLINVHLVFPYLLVFKLLPKLLNKKLLSGLDEGKEAKEYIFQ